MIEGMFGPEGQTSAKAALVPPAVLSRIEEHVAVECDANTRSVVAEIARALIKALEPFAKGGAR